MQKYFGGDFTQEHEWQPPEWWYKERRPSSDNEYFENMSRIILVAGLNWHVIDKKWQTIKKAFCDFSIQAVARFQDEELERLMNDKGVIRNRNKIQAIILNARKFNEIQKENGSFQSYLDGMDKSDNYKQVVKELSKDFKRLNPPSASIFLFSVGEKIRYEGETQKLLAFGRH